MNEWITKGFEGFSRGTCGHAGHNLYVSRKGILQRIHQYDFTGDGHLDLVFCNSQSHWEKPPLYAYPDPLDTDRRVELPSDAALSALVVDLTGDGGHDLVVGMGHNGIRADLNARIYFGSPGGWRERHQQQLPAPMCSDIAAADFTGDGRVDLAFLSRGQVRLFLQSVLGFEPRRWLDLDIGGSRLAAADVDGDGWADLVLRQADGTVEVYWGGADGFAAETCSRVPVDPDPPEVEPSRYEQYVGDVEARVEILSIQGVPHIFVARRQAAYLVPVEGRSFGQPLQLPCTRPLAAALGDITGDGHPDLVVACRHARQEGECSWIFWGGPRDYGQQGQTPLPSTDACDVAVGDLDGDGCADIVLCQSRSEASFSSAALVYRGGTDGVAAAALELPAEDARRVLVGRPAPHGPLQVVLANRFARSALGDTPVAIYLGGAEGFAPERRLDLPGWGAVEAVCCDIDDDGYVDVVLANAAEESVHLDPGSYVLANGPQGFAPEPRLILPTTRAHGVCCADLNRDGYLDLIFCGFANAEILIFYGGEEGFAEPVRLRLEHEGAVYDEPRWIYLADLDNDGWLDLVVPQIAHDRSFVLWGGPQGFSMARCQVLSVFRAACVRAADLSGNGWLDLIVGGHIPSDGGPHDTFLSIYWNGPQGLRHDRRTLLPAYGINALAVADFDGDGRLDLFACSYHDGRRRDIDSYIYWNRPERGFSADDFTRLFTHSASGCVAADFDEDGRTDLAIAYHKRWGDHIAQSAVWYNGPEGFSPERVTWLPTSGPHGMVAVGPGNIADRGPQEYYISAAFELPRGSRLERITWEAEIPPKSWVRAQLRSAASQEALGQAPWSGPQGPASWCEKGQSVAVGGPWIQYRLALGARHSGSSPRVRSVSVHYC